MSFTAESRSSGRPSVNSMGSPRSTEVELRASVISFLKELENAILARQLVVQIEPVRRLAIFAVFDGAHEHGCLHRRAGARPIGPPAVMRPHGGCLAREAGRRSPDLAVDRNLLHHGLVALAVRLGGGDARSSTERLRASISASGLRGVEPGIIWPAMEANSMGPPRSTPRAARRTSNFAPSSPSPGAPRSGPHLTFLPRSVALPAPAPLGSGSGAETSSTRTPAASALALPRRPAASTRPKARIRPCNAHQPSTRRRRRARPPRSRSTLFPCHTGLS